MGSRSCSDSRRSAPTQHAIDSRVADFLQWSVESDLRGIPWAVGRISGLSVRTYSSGEESWPARRRRHWQQSTTSFPRFRKLVMADCCLPPQGWPSRHPQRKFVVFPVIGLCARQHHCEMAAALAVLWSAMPRLPATCSRWVPIRWSGLGATKSIVGPCCFPENHRNQFTRLRPESDPQAPNVNTPRGKDAGSLSWPVKVHRGRPVGGLELQRTHVLRSLAGTVAGAEGMGRPLVSNETRRSISRDGSGQRHVPNLSSVRCSRHVRYLAELQEVPAALARWAELTETGTHNAKLEPVQHDTAFLAEPRNPLNQARFARHCSQCEYYTSNAAGIRYKTCEKMATGVSCSWQTCATPLRRVRTPTTSSPSPHTKRRWVADSFLSSSSVSWRRTRTCVTILVIFGCLSKCCLCKVIVPGNGLWDGSLPDSCVACSLTSRAARRCLVCPF